MFPGSILGQLSYMFLTCEHSTAMHLAVNLTSQCNTNCVCDGVAYSPVCFEKTGTTFFSPCHAACNEWDNEKKIYSGCLCAAEALDVLVKSTFLSHTDATLRTSINTTSPNNSPTISSTKLVAQIPTARVHDDNRVKQPTGRGSFKMEAAVYENDDNLHGSIMTPGLQFQFQHLIQRD